MASKKHIRRTLLLDEGLPPKDKFPQLNKLHTLKHIIHDLRIPVTKDPVIYMLAIKEGYDFILIFNTKDFKKLRKKDGTSIISLSTNLSNKQIDLKICSMLRKVNHGDIRGKIFSISNESK